MKQPINILLVDDHLIILDAYKNSLEQISLQDDNLTFKIDYAKSGDSALSIFKSQLPKNPYDIVFLDIRLPSEDSKYTNGEELAIIFKELSPKTKTIMITGHYDALLFHDILHNINPDGLLFKSDVGMKTISDVVYSILDGIPFYSSSILQLIRKNFSSKISLDETDKLLLYKIAKGTKTKDLKKTVPLSQAGIERRKRYLKEVFKTQKQDDQALIKSAEKKGFL
ncbi:response regulator [Winogradskyella sp.]|uniref:response regulator transcription factor n=1 Tax=Winogradskyella sp. TaxID=1883156 RepID=UPI002620EA8A|nr:response regulator [Winogradskyella sp.]